MSAKLKNSLRGDVQAIKRWLNFNNIVLVASIIAVIFILLAAVLITWANLKITLLGMGVFYINSMAIKAIFFLSVLSLFYIIYYWFYAKKSKKKRLFKLFMFIIIAVLTFSFLMSLTLPFITNIYPGLREVGKTYSPQFWEENNFSAGFKGYTSGLYIYNAHNPKEIYFSEGDKIFGQVGLNNPNYTYTVYLTKDGEDKIILGSYENGTAIISFNVTKSRLYHFEIGVKNSSMNEKRVAVFNIYPNVMAPEKTNERKRDLVVILGSLLAAITMISITIAKRIIEVIER